MPAIVSDRWIEALGCAAIAATTTLDSLPARAADLDVANLLGCWRDTADQTPKGAEQVLLPSGEVGLSWGIDPATGLEVSGLVPYNELCFDPDGTVNSLHVGYDEGLGSSGPYTFDGSILSAHDSYDFADGWLFGSRDAQCPVEIDDNVLIIRGCGDEMRFVRRASQ